MTALSLILARDPLHQHITTHLHQSRQARHASGQLIARLRGLIEPDKADRLREQIRQLETELTILTGDQDAPTTRL